MNLTGIKIIRLHRHFGRILCNKCYVKKLLQFWIFVTIYSHIFLKKFTRYILIYIYPTRCNVTYFIYFWKLLYMFQVVSPPIIRSAHNCIYSIWDLSNRYCYLPLLWRSWNNPSTGAVGSSYGLTSARCCRYSRMCS